MDPGGRLQVSGAAVRLRAQACLVAFAFCGVCSARGASPTAWHGNDRRAWSWCTGTDRLGGRPKGVLRAATALSRLSPLAIVAGASAARRPEVSTIFTLKPERPSLLPLASAWKGQQKVHHLRGAQGAHGWSGRPFGARFLPTRVCPARAERRGAWTWHTSEMLDLWIKFGGYNQLALSRATFRSRVAHAHLYTCSPLAPPTPLVRSRASQRTDGYIRQDGAGCSPRAHRGLSARPPSHGNSIDDRHERNCAPPTQRSLRLVRAA